MNSTSSVRFAIPKPATCAIHLQTHFKNPVEWEFSANVDYSKSALNVSALVYQKNQGVATGPGCRSN
jgi:hypothetical protein